MNTSLTGAMSWIHWHFITLRSNVWFQSPLVELDDVSSSVKDTFPSLATFLSLEKDVIHEVFVGLKIASKRHVKGTSGVILNRNGLDNFMTNIN
jgi:hypothetical protein